MPFPVAVAVHTTPVPVRGPLWRAAVGIGDMVGALGLALLVPVAILAVGIPIVLAVRLLLWAAGML